MEMSLDRAAMLIKLKQLILVSPALRVRCRQRSDLRQNELRFLLRNETNC